MPILTCTNIYFTLFSTQLVISCRLNFKHFPQLYVTHVNAIVLFCVAGNIVARHKVNDDLGTCWRGCTNCKQLAVKIASKESLSNEKYEWKESCSWLQIQNFHCKSFLWNARISLAIWPFFSQSVITVCSLVKGVCT